MTWQPDCGAPPPDPNDPAFLAATAWMVGTAADVDQLAAMLERRAESDLAEGCVVMHPQLVVLVRGGPDDEPGVNVYCLMVPFNETHEKHGALRQIGRTLYGEQKVPLAAAMLTEVWVAVQRDDGPRVEPRHDPARREALCVFAVANSGDGGRLTRYFVTRDAANKMRADGAPERHRSDADHKVTPKLLHQLFLGFAEIPARNMARKV